MKKPPFVTGEIYHIYNRGVEKRNIFMDNQDHFRFINCLAEFNDINPAPPSNIRYLLRNPSQATSECLEVQLLNKVPGRKPIIEILAFCLMPNHYHLLVKQVKDQGIPKFMQKLGTGYTNYFNLRNKRVGSLFQGRFKAILIEEDAHLRHLPTYIHLNPLDLEFPEWRMGNIKNMNRALEFLENYRWSSHPEYSGNNKHNFSSVIKKDLLLNIFKDTGSLKTYTENFIKNSDLEKIKDLVLE